MRKLYELKATVDGLAKIVTTPDADLDVSVGSSLSPQSFGSTGLKGSTDLDTILGKVRFWECITPMTNTCQSIFYCINSYNLFRPYFHL